ncbi:MAG: hypothetical protein KJ749_09940, partial [Planctomycetes bacterium]|nr:hypothetical protein [Planctomycetota bacterium]
RLVIAVAKDFEKMTGRKATKGLLFVTDAADAPLIRNLEKIIDLEVRKKSAEAKSREAAKDKTKTQPKTEGGSPHPPASRVCDTKREGAESLPHTTPAGPVSATGAKDETKAEAKTEDPLEKWNEARKKLGELGLSMDMVLRAMPVPVPKETASLFLGLPKDMTDKSDWIMAMSTKAVIRDLVQKMVVRGIEKADCGPLGKAMAGLLLGVVNIERTMTDAFAMTRDVVLFSIWTNQQSDWSEGEKKKTIDAYVQKRGRETFGGLMAAMAKQAPRQTEAKAEKDGGQKPPDSNADKGGPPPQGDQAP